MSRPAARITHSEVTRLIKAVTSCGLAVQRVTFDGGRVDVVVVDILDKVAVRAPHSFETLEEYEAWREGQGTE